MPRAGLTPERIIAEAATVADQVGLDRLTLAAVAQRCGVSLPGLYKHVSGLEEVKRGISVAAIRELTASMAASAAGRYAASVRAPTPGDQEYADATSQALAVISAALKGYHLDGPDLIHAIRM